MFKGSNAVEKHRHRHYILQPAGEANLLLYRPCSPIKKTRGATILLSAEKGGGNVVHLHTIVIIVGTVFIYASKIVCLLEC
jgi:hypothetical protein